MGNTVRRLVLDVWQFVFHKAGLFHEIGHGLTYNDYLQCFLVLLVMFLFLTQYNNLPDLAANSERTVKQELDCIMKAENAYKSGRFQDAVENYSEALKNETSMDRNMKKGIFYNRSLAYGHLGKHTSALEDATKTFEIAPKTFPEGYLQAAAMLEALKNRKQQLGVLSNGLQETSPSTFDVEFILKIAVLLSHLRVRFSLIVAKKIRAETWRCVFDELARQGNWALMKILLLDDSIDNMEMCGMDIQIINLLDYCRTAASESRLWGQSLAVALIEKGSTFNQSDALTLMKRAVDLGIDSGSFELLRYFFDNQDTDMKDARGNNIGDNLYQYIINSHDMGNRLTSHAICFLVANGVKEQKRKKVQTRVEKLKAEIRQLIIDLDPGQLTELETDCTSDAPGSEPITQDEAIDLPSNSSSESVEDERNDPGGLSTHVFDVECTSEVWNTLNRRTLDGKMRSRISKKIDMLASGDFSSQPHLKKPLLHPHVQGPLELYEAKITKSARLIWEIAIQYSPNQNDPSAQDGNMTKRKKTYYVDVIRIWDIVFNHDRISKSVENIARAYDRGKGSILRTRLKQVGARSLRNTADGRKLPILFCEADDTVDTIDFIQPLGPQESEYHILKWYSYAYVSIGIQQNPGGDIDFPFKPTKREVAIIDMIQDPPSPILLLGRSGTGKTTCCFNRLWFRYIDYWKHTIIDNPRLTSFVVTADGQQKTTLKKHLHQIFITKNPVLCTEIKNTFEKFCNGSLHARQHVQVAQLPTRFQSVDSRAYPLFLTSRQFLTMLDASLPRPYFFKRNPDGTLKERLSGFRETANSLAFISDRYEDQQIEAGIELKSNSRKMVTYELFVDELWPSMVKAQKERVSYHPSLVWTEINSFIKGSIEALHSQNGFLDLTTYEELGKKRAANFPGKRGEIYDLFIVYCKLVTQRNFFDEADLLFNLYKRIDSMQFPEWSFYEIYVDETQDFTQAELALLIRTSSDPNSMFLTGDTAQCIMHGIAFRFEDLKSLFHYARKSQKDQGNENPVEVPRTIYQLTHNYRSHTGILNLASSILDLLAWFFPASYDRKGIERDIGIVDGPKPVILDFDESTDLADILCGSRCETSKIEFGAHQAIIVVNERARHSMPEELRNGLVLTIDESKGLEFDDVLLYNFFTNSEAKKEWRVVIQHLHHIIEEQQTDASAGKPGEIVEIDFETLQAKDCPRPIAFDPSMHKILNSELKRLYTVVTRARVNMWIFDGDDEARAPMFTYFKARKLVRVERREDDDSGEDRKKTYQPFPKKSSREEWKKRGDQFLRGQRYKLAADCFEKAGNAKLHRLCLAFQLESDAKRTQDEHMKRERYLEVSLEYIKCREYQQAMNCLKYADEFDLANKLLQSGKCTV